MRDAPWRLVWTALAVSVAASCANDLAPGDREVINRWLNCAECREGERATVRALGRRAVPTLKRALREGPPAENRENMQAKFNAVYSSIKVTTSGPGPDTSALPRAAYVQRGVANYVATYQSRAAVSLGDIGGPEAESALRDAAQAGPDAYSTDVRQAIGLAVGRSGPDSAQFLGSVTPRNPGFGDTVIVQPPAFEPFDANELAAIDGSPVSPADTKVFGSAGQLRFIAVAFPGQRRLTIQNVGTTPNSQHTELVVRTLVDLNDRAMATCPDHPCRVSRAPRYVAFQSAVSAFFTLWRTASSADSVDMVKLYPPSLMMHATATLSWSPATANLDLRWVECTTNAAVGNTDGATANNPEITTADVPGGDCWLLLVQLISTSTSSPVIAHLRLSP
jgi:hypothetical protein